MILLIDLVFADQLENNSYDLFINRIVLYVKSTWAHNLGLTITCCHIIY